MTFKTQMKIHFDDADPAGIAFSGGLFSKAHHCFEDFIAALNQDPKEFFLHSETMVPLRHMEAEYFAPLMPLETYPVEVAVLKISESSFQLQFAIGPNPKPHCIVRSTHVCVSKKSREKQTIPTTLRENLEKFVLEK